MDVELTADLVAPCSTAALFDWVDDLAKYPQWMPLVHRAEPIDAPAGDAAWMVELRARVGPLARSKRLRMARTRLTHPTEVCFERAELDGRRHAPWTLRAELHDATASNVTTEPPESRLLMRLHYGGGLWTGGLLERVLADQIEQGKQNLLALLTAPTR